MRTTLGVISGKWKPLILMQFDTDVMRFSKFQKLIPEINKQMLTKNLRELEKDGIINRKVYAVVPPKVEYSLTKKGKTLVPVLEIMATWGQEQMNGK